MDGKRVIGVDIGKRWVDVAREGAAEVERHPNEPAAMAALVATFDARSDIIVFERCGGYERKLEAALAAAECRGRWCIRRRSRHFAKFKVSKPRLMPSMHDCCGALGAIG